MQVVPVVQGLKQAPQWAALVVSTTHSVPHTTEPAGH
jgi:hypothetical protein